MFLILLNLFCILSADLTEKVIAFSISINTGDCRKEINLDLRRYLDQMGKGRGDIPLKRKLFSFFFF